MGHFKFQEELERDSKIYHKTQTFKGQSIFILQDFFLVIMCCVIA